MKTLSNVNCTDDMSIFQFNMKRDAFYGKHGEEIHLYEVAKSYLYKVMNGHTALPIKSWRDEAVKLAADKFALCDEFYRLKEDIRNVEVLKRTAVKMMGGGYAGQ